MKKGKVIIISAPSGCGKSTIIKEIEKRGKATFKFSVSATNRLPRAGEENGVNYYFLSSEDFKEHIRNNDFIEFEEVYPGRYYGTLRSEVEKKLEAGENVLLDIDVKGGINVAGQFGPDAISIFILPPSVEELRRRLVGRATDSAEVIEERVSKAEYELSFAGKYDHRVMNDNLEDAVQLTEKLIVDFTS